MSQTVQQCKDYLNVLCKCNAKQRQGILEGADPMLVKAISEITLNVINGNIPLTYSQKRRLSQHKSTIRSLADKKRSLKAKKGMPF